MYGLEQERKFDFDLEKEIKKKPKRKEEIASEAKAKIEEIKNMLKSRQHEADFDKLGILLNGYDALIKVISKIKT